MVLGAGARASYLFNSSIAGLEDADAILILGANPRKEAAIVNARLRKIWLNDFAVDFALIGEKADLTYEYDYLGAGPDSLEALVGGNDGFAKAFKNAKRPAILIGSGALNRKDSAAIIKQLIKLGEVSNLVSDEWNGFNILQTAASRVGALDLGFLPGEGGYDFSQILEGAKSGEIEVVFNLGADECDMTGLEKAFVIYQGHHGDAGARVADIVLPGAAYTEQNGTYVNMEGRVQMAIRASFPPGDAREDWAILRALSDHAGKTLGYDDQLSLRGEMIEQVSSFGVIDSAPAPSGFSLKDLGEGLSKGGGAKDGPFLCAIGDFYLTNPVARASATMAECSAVASGKSKLAAE